MKSFYVCTLYTFVSVARLRNVESSSTVLAGLKLTPSCFFSVHRLDRKTTFIFVKRSCEDVAQEYAAHAYSLLNAAQLTEEHS